MNVLDSICKKESLVLPKQLAAKIAANCRGNLRRAILTLESSKVQRYVYSFCYHLRSYRDATAVVEWCVFLSPDIRSPWIK
jgi:DNA polymerase III delta prime subunit